MKQEVLYTCPKCKQVNFTARGLKAHNCERRLAKIKTGDAPGLASLQALSITQISKAYGRLHELGDACDKLSGVVAVLKGIVLMEAKARLKHGEYLPWLEKNLGKSRNSAAEYVRIAGEFVKCNPRVTFGKSGDQLGASLAIIDRNNLAVDHPVVVAVNKWTKNRSQYQLLQEIKKAKPEKIETDGGGDGDDEEPPADIVKQSIAEFATSAETVRAVKEEMSDDEYDAAISEARKHLELLTDCTWDNAGKGAPIDAHEHGDIEVIAAPAKARKGGK